MLDEIDLLLSTNCPARLQFVRSPADISRRSIYGL
jgi:hypothetical protein